MDEDTKDLAKIGMEVALRPVTGVVTDFVGLFGGDYIREKRQRNKKRLEEETQKVFKERGVKEPIEPSPNISVPLLAAAVDEDRDELVTLWAKLIATAMDAKRAHLYRREFAEVVKKLEPLDARVLAELPNLINLNGVVRNILSDRWQLPSEAIQVALQNLAALELAYAPNSGNLSPDHARMQFGNGQIVITSRGSMLLRAVNGSI